MIGENLNSDQKLHVQNHLKEIYMQLSNTNIDINNIKEFESIYSKFYSIIELTEANRSNFGVDIEKDLREAKNSKKDTDKFAALHEAVSKMKIDTMDLYRTIFKNGIEDNYL